jgi:2,4-didehydro-3-deoxy-L-rhamnonate hydrolase
MSFRLANIAGRAALCDTEHWFDLERVSGGAFGPDVMDAIARADELHAVALDASPDGALAGADFRAAVPRPRNCFAIGLNYHDHAAESGMEPPATPLTFAKFPGCLSGANDDVVLASEFGDYEVEVVVVVGRGGRDIATGSAWQHIMGVTGGQDISDRMLQFAATPPHFDLGKSRDTYGPIGPVIVSVDAFDDPNAIALSCSINGEVRQSGNSSGLIFGVPALVEYLSSILTLRPGDVIFTGTPAGVGATTRTFLRPGDVIESTIEGVGTLRNVCV